MLMKTYYPTIGLEIHAELKTQTKMFCSCKNDPDEERPNVNICPVCMAHPGALPVINKKAVENVIKVGLALDAKIADFTEFDRKNYFYPDIPKGYQISQYQFPIVSGGHLLDIDITRVHLEEDTANNKHDRGDYSLIDFNRAGVPLMELVTEPVIHDAKTASDFARELQLLLRHLDVSEANMEKGEMRVEANISISPNPKKFGTKVEVKNSNSFKSVEKAIAYEIARMTELYESGKEAEIVQETRGWDDNKQSTFSQRTKENSQDYRYFPDPDLPKLKLHEAFDLDKMKKELPELPIAKRARYKKEYGLKDEDIEVFINNPKWEVWLEKVAKNLNNKDKIQIASNFITTDFAGLVRKNGTVNLPSENNFVELVNLFAEGKISSRVAKDILAIIALQDESPMKIATEKNLLQQNDEGDLSIIVGKIISENPEIVAIYRAGKENAIMSLVGKIIKESNGSANPQIVIQLLKEMLK